MPARTTWISARGEPTGTLLLRHGQTPMSVQKRYSGRTDAPLTDAGVQQAAAAAKRLASAGIGVIVSSPLERAVQTAQEVAAVTGVPVVTDDGFREADFGAWEGLTFAEVKERWPAELTTWLADPTVARGLGVLEFLGQEVKVQGQGRKRVADLVGKAAGKL